MAVFEIQGQSYVLGTETWSANPFLGEICLLLPNLDHESPC